MQTGVRQRTQLDGQLLGRPVIRQTLECAVIYGQPDNGDVSRVCPNDSENAEVAINISAGVCRRREQSDILLFASSLLTYVI